MLERVILRLKECGVTEIVINIHHFGELIIDFLKAHDNFGIKILISDEHDLLLDTGGGILKAAALLEGDEPFIVHNVDILSDVDLVKMYNSHLESGSDVTLLVSERSTSRYLLFDESMRMVGWENIKSGEVLPKALDATNFVRRAFGGIHVINPGVLSKLAAYNPGGAFPIIPFYVAECGTTVIRGYQPKNDYAWYDIGSVEKLHTAELWLSNK
jgi:NDP-sugar pyrophosphorylase family protein